MSFNIDDPLAGILSDGSDDSFFDDDILGKKKPVKKKTTPTAEKKNALFDLGPGEGEKPNSASIESRKGSLFDLGIQPAKKSSAPTLDEDKASKSESTQSPGPFKRTVSKESIKFPAEPKNKPLSDVTKSPAKSKVTASIDRLDIFGNIEQKKDILKPLEKGKSSQSLLDDILGESSTKIGGSSQATRPASTAKSQDFDLDSIIGKSESKQTTTASIKTALQKQSFKIDSSKQDSKNSKSSEDWLGIFQKEEENDEDDNAGMPAWLVGDKKKKKPETKKTTKDVTVKEPPKTEEVQEVAPNAMPQDLNIEQQLKLPVSITMPTMPTMLSMAAGPRGLQASNEDITAEGAALYLEQQESQLMLALQLKAQEEKLAAMQVRQKEGQRIQREAAHAQHAQVDAILQRQAAQRRQMQAIIAAHQERITERIKDLLSTTTTQNEEHTDANNEDVDSNPTERKESPHAREKKQLLQLVQSLQENHDKEIDLMETSYRRQLAFLEVSVNHSEERMKEESDKLMKFYTEKINWLDEHHQLYKKLTEDNLTSLTERHKAENEMLRQQHLENIRVLQEHHAVLMENIKNSVKQEQILIQDAAGFSSDLHDLVSDVKESKSQCQLLVEKVKALTENGQRETERTLQTREMQINDMIHQLRNERENFETEKTESRDMVKILETRLKQMTTMIEEETGSLKQKKMEFEFEKATFTKQTEFARNILKKQEEEIKMIREDVQREYKDKISKIDEEKSKALKDSAIIAKEKASIQNLKQELEKTKAELQAQLEEASEERSKLNVEKQQMHIEEQRILSKSRDLDLLAKTAIEKQTQADKKYSEAEFIQKKYEDRIRRMQEHVVSLNAREKQIAKEKVALSRERLSLHNEKKQIESRHCSLCKPSQTAYNFEPTHTLPDPFLNVPVPREFGSTGANYAMSAMEQEMANLMGRNFNQKHSTVRNGSHEDTGTIEESFHATQSAQMNSGAFKDSYMDPKFMMLRLDVQQVLSNLDHTKKDDDNKLDKHSE